MATLKEAFEYSAQNPNSEFAKNFEKLAASGALDQEAKTFGLDMTPFKPVPVEQGFLSRVGTSIKERGAEMVETREKLRAGEIGGASAVLQGAGQLAGMVLDPLTVGVGMGLEKTGLDKPLGAVVGAVADTAPVQGIIDYYQGLSPEAQKNVNAVFNIGALIPVGLVAKPIAGATAGVVKSGAEAATVAGLKTVAKAGEVTSKVGKATYKSAITPTVAEAERILAHEASKAPLLQRIIGKGKDIIPKAAPITRADTALAKGIMGTEKQIGVQAKRTADALWKQDIAPALAKSTDVMTKDEMFAPILERIAKTAEPSKKKAYQNAFEAIQEDYINLIKVPIQEAQKIKEGLAQFTPSKVFRGQEVASEVRMLQADMAGAIRVKINTSLKDINAQAAYRDYGNLKELQKIGVKAISESGLKAGFGNFMSSMWDAAAAPIKTVGGLVLYKVGNKMQFMGEKGLKTFGEHMKSKGFTKPNMTASPRQSQIAPPELKSQVPLPKSIPPSPSKVNPLPKKKVTTDPLTAKQAIAKGMTEDDWVKAQGTPMYRGTDIPQAGELKSADTYGLAYGKGAYLASDKRFAGSYGKNIIELYPKFDNPFVMNKEVSKNFLIQFKKDFPTYNKKYGTTGEDVHSFIGNADEANIYLESKGYDGLLNASSGYSEQSIVFNTQKVRTTSQLRLRQHHQENYC